MTTIHIEFAPANKPGTYWPVMNGERLTKATRSPFFDGARALLALGVAEDAPMTASHAGASTVQLQSTVGEAAKWSVSEFDRGGLRRVRYTPYSPRTVDATIAAGDAE